MPTYSYRCTACDNAFDIVQSFSDDSLSICEVCGGKLRKVFSAIGVTFNGSGFYRTDSRAGSSSGGAGSVTGSSESTSSGKSSDAKSSSGSSSSGSSSSGSSSSGSSSSASSTAGSSAS
ncbi:FmdB family zinc ribbon protein [Rathayibacter sp. YIM 133350]|uniref:FmdB family zinc ribbon protein n=1 Tax=Rathayibacter sp. YIM 133350 TaxID=3131992 RepID=UPI00307FAB20